MSDLKLALEQGYDGLGQLDVVRAVGRATALFRKEMNIAARGADIYIFGSFGRRLAIANYTAGVTSVDEYISWARGEDLPRESERNTFDIDVAVPTDQISWSSMAAISKKVTEASGMKVEIDPHQMVETRGSLIAMRGTESVIPLDGSLEFETGCGIIKTLSISANLLYMASWRNIRPKDIGEIRRLMGLIRKDSILTEEEAYKSAIGIWKEYLRSRKAVIALARVAYYGLFPQSIRERLRLSDRVRVNQVGLNMDYGFDSPDPILI